MNNNFIMNSYRKVTASLSSVHFVPLWNNINLKKFYTPPPPPLHSHNRLVLRTDFKKLIKVKDIFESKVFKELFSSSIYKVDGYYQSCVHILCKI